MKFSKIIAGFLLLAGASIFVQSCSKDELDSSRKTYYEKNLSSHLDAAKKFGSQLPEFVVYNEKSNKYITVNMQEKSFSFSTPNDGWNFSNSDDVVFVDGENGGGILFIGSDALGGNTGGIVVAGNSAVPINYTFCFSASDEALGLDLVDLGTSFDGISLVLGIAGDFEALANDELDEEDDIEFTDFFQGMAAYIVYDNEASGSYDVFDWFEDLDNDQDDLADAAFGYVFDFVEEGIYFTVDGSMTVSGGSINFQGEYFAILNFFLDFFDGEEEDDDIELDIVDGYGEMGCS